MGILRIAAAGLAALAACLAAPQPAHADDPATGHEQVPLEEGEANVVLINGLFNLNPHRRRILAEAYRLLRPRGSLFAAELVLKEPLRRRKAFSLDDWFS